MKTKLFRTVLVTILLIAFTGNTVSAQDGQTTMWINHLDLRTADATLQMSVSSGAQFVSDSLIIGSTSVGDKKWVVKALEVPPGYNVTGVLFCYQLSTPKSFISQIRLGQLQDPPVNWLVLHDDATGWTSAKPVCEKSAIGSGPSIDSWKRTVTLSLRLNFNNTNDKIAIIALGLLLKS